MSSESSSKLTKDHIIHATPSQLGKLLGKNPNTISRWNRRGISTNLLKIFYSCIDRETLVIGLIRRKEEFEKAESLQKEFDEILQNHEKLQEPIVA